MVWNQYKCIGVKQKLQMINDDVNNRDRQSKNDSIKEQYVANYNIHQPKVRLIDTDGNNLGVLTTREALTIAQNEMLDLVLINSTAEPPVARICDYTKFIYEAKRNKKEQDRKLRENAIHTKEIQLRPNITTHDLEIKLHHAKEWLDDNCKIKIVVKFRGRELAYKSKGFDMLNGFVEKLNCKIEKAPDLGGNTIIAVITPAAKTTKPA
jgi:translation initiation factor IF-3